MKVKGQVKKVFTRDVKGKKYYSVCVGGAEEDGSDLWASCGTVYPPCKENDEVSFTAVKDGKYWKVDAAEIVVSERRGPTPTGGGGGGGWNDPARQKSIVAQSAMKMAIDFVGVALGSGALALGAATAKAPAKWEALSAAVKEKAMEFYVMANDPDAYFDGADTAAKEEEEEFNPVGE